MSYPNPLQPSFTVSLAVFSIFVSTLANAQYKRKISKSLGNYLILAIYSNNLPESVCITIFPGTDAFTGTNDTQNMRHFENLGNLPL